MLHRITRLAFYALLIVAFAACDSDEGGGGNGGGGGGGNGGGGGGGGDSMTATIDGEAFEADFVFAVTSMGFVLTASDDSGERTLLLSVLGESISTGTYPMGPSETVVASGSFVTDTGDAQVDVHNSIPGSGQIVLQSYSSGGASGTFNFTGRNLNGDEVTVSNGTFDVDF